MAERRALARVGMGALAVAFLLDGGAAWAQSDDAVADEAFEEQVDSELEDPLDALLMARTRTPSQVGSLHRAAGTLESVLDIYRLALMELVPAIGRVRREGRAKGATPETALAGVVVEVFQAVERSLRRRVPEQALEPISRGYHAEVMDYLEVLSGAVAIGDVVRPARGMLVAMQRVCERGDEVVDLFSRNRPIRTRVVDKVEILDELAEALEELEAADRHVARLRKARAAHDRVALGYRRLEIALGHVLNLWALARDSGLDFSTAGNHVVAGLDVPAQISTESLEAILVRVRHYLTELEELLAPMERPPPGFEGQASATLLEQSSGEAKVRLQWRTVAAVEPELAPAAAIRIYRGDDVATTQRLLSEYLRCRGKADDEIRRVVDTNLASLSAEPIRVASLAPGRGSWSETLAAAPVAPPVYRVASVSAFGIEARAPAVTPVTVPPVLEGAGAVEARLAGGHPSDDAFYRDVDRVGIAWAASPNDVRRDPQRLAFASANAVPIVDAYIVERLVGDQEGEIIAIVPSGQTRLRDHPSAKALAAGVRYRITARSTTGRLARAPEACSVSERIREDLAPRLAVARAGAAHLEHPNAWQRRRIEELADPETFRRAAVHFGEHSPEQREALLRAWWLSVPRTQRERWLRSWPQLRNDDERQQWLRSWNGEVSARDLPWARVALFLTAFPQLGSEVERWWELLDAGARERYVEQWRMARSPAYRAWFDGLVKAGGAQRARALSPVMQTAWWLARDPVERSQRLLPWWEGLDAAERHEALMTWYAGLPEAARRTVRWPLWELRPTSERQQLLEMGYHALPPKLERRALAWIEWEEMKTEQRVAEIRSEVGVLRAGVASMRWALRPLDLWLSFHLSAALSVVLIAAAFGALAWRVRRRPTGDVET